MDEPYIHEQGGVTSLIAGNGAIWLHRGKCAMCGTETDILTTDSSHEVIFSDHLCEPCIGKLFAMLREGRGE